jgi:predicted secreted hydrolase
MSRLLALLACIACCAAAAAEFAPVRPGVALRFPHDLGAHPRHRIEWWYATGQLETRQGTKGFQVTFFRVRNPAAEGGTSRFAPSQILFAHAALSDPARGRLLHDQRSARALPPLVEAREGNTHVRIDDWRFVKEEGGYATTVNGRDFALDLRLEATQPLMLQGDGGFSRKGPEERHASHYYSEPHLRVSGRIRAGTDVEEVRGTAWLDHEWSSELLPEGAVGWDWLGANLDGGGALMAFRMRDGEGRTLWSTATRRERGDAPPRTLQGDEVRLEPTRWWTSPQTGTRYPVAMRLKVGSESWELEPLMDNQELDSRASTGTLYWEGAVRLKPISGPGGRGYLELTGYADRVAF